MTTARWHWGISVVLLSLVAGCRSARSRVPPESASDALGKIRANFEQAECFRFEFAHYSDAAPGDRPDTSGIVLAKAPDKLKITVDRGLWRVAINEFAPGDSGSVVWNGRYVADTGNFGGSFFPAATAPQQVAQVMIGPGLCAATELLGWYWHGPLEEEWKTLDLHFGEQRGRLRSLVYDLADTEGTWAHVVLWYDKGTHIPTERIVEVEGFRARETYENFRFDVEIADEAFRSSIIDDLVGRSRPH